MTLTHEDHVKLDFGDSCLKKIQEIIPEIYLRRQENGLGFSMSENKFQNGMHIMFSIW